MVQPSIYFLKGLTDRHGIRGARCSAYPSEIPIYTPFLHWTLAESKKKKSKFETGKFFKEI